MFIKHHSLEAYYLQRRLQLLETLNSFAKQSFAQEDFVMETDHWKIQMLEREYSDVIDPERLCATLKQIYPDNLFSIKSKES
jgi:hypothetical protein